MNILEQRSRRNNTRNKDSNDDKNGNGNVTEKTMVYNGNRNDNETVYHVLEYLLVYLSSGSASA